jgi:hypothetical protein
MEKPRVVANAFQPGNKVACKGGKPGNVNAMTSGRRAAKALAIGKLPPNCGWITTRVNQLRRGLEAAAVDRYGELTLKAALLIQSVCRHEQAALLAQRWLRIHGDKMNHSEKLTYLTTVASESDRRDRAVDKLALDPAETGSILDSLYGPKITEVPADDVEGSNDG